MTRGEVWLVAYNEPARPGEPGRARPSVIVSSNRLNRTSSASVITVPLTTRNRGLPIHVEVDAGFLDDVSYAQAEKVGVTSRSRCLHRLGVIDGTTMRAIDGELRSVLGL